MSRKFDYAGTCEWLAFVQKARAYRCQWSASSNPSVTFGEASVSHCVSLRAQPAYREWSATWASPRLVLRHLLCAQKAVKSAAHDLVPCNSLRYELVREGCARCVLVTELSCTLRVLCFRPQFLTLSACVEISKNLKPPTSLHNYSGSLHLMDAAQSRCSLTVVAEDTSIRFSRSVFKLCLHLQVMFTHVILLSFRPRRLSC